MKRRIRYMALVLVLCMLALTGCAQPRDTMTLRVCLDAAPATLDPAMASSDAERTVVAHLFENLMKLSRGEDGSIQPVYAAAKSYTVEDNLDGTETYTFTLRQNVRWSDGQTVTAHDFVYAWQRLADPATGSPHAALLDMVAGFDQVQAKQDGSLLQVSAPDDFTFVVKLSYKCAYFLTDVCAGTATMPVRSDAAEREDWSLHSETLLTDGPYRATGWDETGLTAQAADGYYDARRLGPDVLEFRFETDGQARADLLSGGDVETEARAWAAAGSDARMNGCEMPVVICSGSGNQGITASVPVWRYGVQTGRDRETILRAVCLSDLITIHQKTGIGRLSAYCGAVSAGVGAGCGIAWLRGADYEGICQTITNAAAMISGCICDGAKASCASKIAMGVETGILGYNMYLRGNSFRPGDGIVGRDVEETIRNVGILASQGMKETDRVILKIMTE